MAGHVIPTEAQYNSMLASARDADRLRRALDADARDLRYQGEAPVVIVRAGKPMGYSDPEFLYECRARYPDDPPPGPDDQTKEFRWTDGEEGYAYVVGGGSLSEGRDYIGAVMAHYKNKPVVGVVSTGAAGDVFLAVITGGPDPQDFPPAGEFGQEWIPPRFSPNVYTIEPVRYDPVRGRWRVDTERSGGVAYRSPMAPSPGARISVGQVVFARPAPLAPGRFEFECSGSMRSTVVTWPTVFGVACVHNVDGTVTAKSYKYERSMRWSGPGLCVSSPTSQEG